MQRHSSQPNKWHSGELDIGETNYYPETTARETETTERFANILVFNWIISLCEIQYVKFLVKRISKRQWAKLY
jgi:hypothetical protein